MPNAAIPNLESFPEPMRKAFKYVQSALNNLGQQTNAQPVGATAAPQPLAALNVTGGAGILHATINDPSPAYRGNTYHMEVVPTGGNFEAEGHPIHTGPARAYRGMLGAGVYDVRACSGYNTSNPSPWIYQRGVDATGSTPPSFPKTTGSGTGGGAWGNVPYDGDTPPKRA